MANATEAHDHMHQQLREAICLLTLITSRPPNFDELFPVDDNNGAESTVLTDDEEDDLEDELENPKVGGSGEGEAQIDLVILRNRVLDRLAEVLARYKSAPGYEICPSWFRTFSEVRDAFRDLELLKYVHRASRH